MQKITVDELFNLIRFGTEGKFFSVTFQRRTDRRDGSAVAGDLRTMLCRTNMTKFKLGVVSDFERDEEDFRNAIITCWDFGQYIVNRRTGLSKRQAGFRSWRRIDICGIRNISLLNRNEIILPPKIRPHLHRINNVFRLANLPEVMV